jgi:hypothetical protein
MTRPRSINGAGDLFGGDGLNGAVDVNAQNLRSGWEGCNQQQKRDEERGKAFHGKPPDAAYLKKQPPLTAFRPRQRVGTEPAHLLRLHKFTATEG